MAIALGPKIHYYLLAAGALLLIIGVLHQQGGVDTLRQSWQSANGVGSAPSKATHGQQSLGDLPTFHEIAAKHGTDKVSDHHYWYMYDKYLPAIRQGRVKFLEIGLGCNMAYGPGASYHTWLEYFPNVDLYFIEYDADCAAKWAHKTTDATIVTGDQADGPFLDRFIAEHGSDFDVIIDDGGHTMNQQITSLNHLWKAVKPGGIYFCEDLQTSYMIQYGGDESSPAGWRGQGTMMAYIYEIISDKMRSGHHHKLITEELRSVDCDREICAFIKKEPGDV